MLKKFVLIAFFALPAVAFAQESKIAYVNYSDVITAMPEFKQMNDSLEKAGNAYQAELKIWYDDLAKKYSDFIAQRDSLNENIKARREEDLRSQNQKIEEYQQWAAQEQEKLQEELFAPIQAKFQKAVDDVGKENNFIYIIRDELLFYKSNSAPNATNLVKRKLGIQ